MSEIAVRVAKPEDIGFIKKTWLYSYYNGNTDMQNIDKSIFMHEYGQIINAILTHNSTLVRVACLADDPNIIVSFSVVGHFSDKEKPVNVLHFVYTKKLWRGNEIHLQILPDDLQFCSHMTRQFYEIKPKTIKFNPFLLRMYYGN